MCVYGRERERENGCFLMRHQEMWEPGGPQPELCFLPSLVQVLDLVPGFLSRNRGKTWLCFGNLQLSVPAWPTVNYSRSLGGPRRPMSSTIQIPMPVLQRWASRGLRWQTLRAYKFRNHFYSRLPFSFYISCFEECCDFYSQYPRKQ